MTRLGLAVVSGCLLLAGCGGDGDSVAGDEPITPAAIAAVAQEHVDLEARRITPWDVFTRELGVESPGASLEYADLSLDLVVAPGAALSRFLFTLFIIISLLLFFLSPGSHCYVFAPQSTCQSSGLPKSFIVPERATSRDKHAECLSAS